MRSYLFRGGTSAGAHLDTRFPTGWGVLASVGPSSQRIDKGFVSLRAFETLHTCSQAAVPERPSYHTRQAQGSHNLQLETLLTPSEDLLTVATHDDVSE
jgi:hypothetical protein